MVTENQKKETLNLLFQAINASDLSRIEKARLNLVLRVRPRVRDRIVDVVATELATAGMVLADGTYGIDLDVILAFLRELLPIILEILGWFS